MDKNEKQVRRNMRAAVRRGAELLDRAFPTWFKRIDLDTLNLASCENCICGQLARHSRAMLSSFDYDGFADSLLERFAKDEFGYGTTNFSIAYGFISRGDADKFYGTREAWRATEQMWRREIRQRLRDAEAIAA